MCVTVAMKLPRDKKTGKPTKDAKWRLAKIRDRAYDPEYKVRRYTVQEHGASQLFLIDTDSDWTEGVSVNDKDFYLSLINSALNNTSDKKDGKSKSKGNGGSVALNGKIIRNALKQGKIEDAVKTIIDNRIDGCTLITNGDRLFVIEITLPAEIKDKYRAQKEKTGKKFEDLVNQEEYAIEVQEIKDGYMVVRTNHGVLDDEFGYQPKDGESFDSSTLRRQYTEKAIDKDVFEPLDLIVTLSKLGREDIDKNAFFRPLRLKKDILANSDLPPIYTTSIIQIDPSGTMIVKPIECTFDIKNPQNLIDSKYKTHLVILPHRSRMFESFKELTMKYEIAKSLA